MARIRNIKPDMWANERLSACSAEAHMLAAALLNYADDDGYFNAHPELVRSGTLPLRDLSTTIPVLLSELAAIGYITLGHHQHKRVGRIVAFRTHQRVAKPTPTRWPVASIEWDENPAIPVALPDDYGTTTGTLPEGSTAFSTLLPDGSATVPVEVMVGSGSGSGSGKGNGNGKGSGKSIARSASRIARQTDEEPPGFCEFWKLYPRKEAKTRARQAWDKQQCEGMAERITSDIRERLRANWLGKAPEFIPHPASYLNGARWHDALIYPTPDTGKIGAAADRLRARMAQHDAELHTVGDVIELAADDWGFPP